MFAAAADDDDDDDDDLAYLLDLVNHLLSKLAQPYSKWKPHSHVYMPALSEWLAAVYTAVCVGGGEMLVEFIECFKS